MLKDIKVLIACLVIMQTMYSFGLYKKLVKINAKQKDLDRIKRMIRLSIITTILNILLIQ